MNVQSSNTRGRTVPIGEEFNVVGVLYELTSELTTWRKKRTHDIDASRYFVGVLNVIKLVERRTFTLT